MNPVVFTKMHGLGNDFMVVDNREGTLNLDTEEIRRLADRHTGVGFDQLLMVQQSSHPSAVFDYRIFNADGQEVEHCGNGARCFARYVHERGLVTDRQMTVNTLKGLISLNLHDDGDVTVAMGVPAFEPDKVPFVAESESKQYVLAVGEQELSVGVASIGNPHVLVRVDDLQDADVTGLGAVIERHPRFPQRVNVGFMQVFNRQHIGLRVFERGVGETRACGSGACAAVAIAHRQGVLDNRATVSLPGGDLQIYWPNLHASIEMTGPCSTVFEGQTRM